MMTVELKSMTDRRKDLRVDLHEPHPAVLVHGEKLTTSSIEDVSLYGLRLRTSLDLPIGTYVRVALPAEPSGSLPFDARIMWRKNVSSGPYSHEWGLLVMGWLNVAEYQRYIGDLPGIPSLDRRIKQRRYSREDAPTPSDNRRNERRGAGGLRHRTEAAAAGLDRWGAAYTYERVIESSNAAVIRTKSSSKIMLGSNNYLGLTDHPAVKEAATKAIERYGSGAGGVRVLSGTMDLHRQLEEKIAAFKGVEAALVFSSGYVTNFALLSTLMKNGDVIFNDEVNHASIIDGCRATEATIRFYRHGSVESLEKKLAQYDYGRPKLIISDGVFSMDGDICPLTELHRLARTYNASLMVDDAHATGVIGPNGRGTAEHFGLTGKVDITIATFSKALAGIGGAICGSKSMIKYITHHARQFIFSSALPPSVCAGVIAAIDVITAGPGMVKRLNENGQFLRRELAALGYKIPPTKTPIIPIIIGDEAKTYQLANVLDEMGVFVNAVSRPAVPRELSRLRVSVMATHTRDQLARALDAFRKAGQSLGIIP